MAKTENSLVFVTIIYIMAHDPSSDLSAGIDAHLVNKIE